MTKEMTVAMDPDQFRSQIAQTLAKLGHGEVTYTNHHIRFASGKYAGHEVEFTIAESYGGKTDIKVDGQVVRRIEAGHLGNRQSVMMTFAALFDAFEARREQAESIAQEQQDTSKCNLLLKDFPLLDTDPFKWSVSNGRIHISCDASFGPKDFVNFKDLVEMLRITLDHEQGSNGQEMQNAE